MVAVTSTIAVLVCDLVDSTARHARLGEDAADLFRREFFAAMRTAVDRSDGEVVKNLGDGLLVVFRRSTVDALQCAHDLHDAMTPLAPGDPVQLRIGVSAGEAVEEDGDWFGMSVIEASRLCAAATPGTTATTAVVRSLAGSRGGHAFTPVGPKILQGIPEPVEVWTVQRGRLSADPPPPADPRRRRRPVALASAVAAALVALVFVAVMVRRNDSTATGEQTTTSAGRTSVAAVSTTSVPVATTATPPVAKSRVVAPAGYTPTIRARDCATDVVASRAQGIECWTLTVPEDRANPTRTIELYGYRIPARTGAASAPVVIDLGPSHPIEFPLAEVATIVQIPSRGYGLSAPPFACPEVDAVRVKALDRPSGDASMASEELDTLRACRKRLVAEGFNLSSYGLDAEIGDITDYLIAAHVDEAFLTAASPDAPAVLVAADRFPGTFRGVILENPVDPSSSYLADPARDLAAAFARLGALCAADRACASAYPDLAGDVKRRWAQLTAAPMRTRVKAAGFAGRVYPANPDRDLDVLVDGARATEALAIALDLQPSYGVIPLAATDTTGAFVDTLARLAVNYELGAATLGEAANHSYRCSARPRVQDTGASSALALPTFGAFYDARLAERCAVWDVPLLPVDFTSLSTGETPTLIAVGPLAPIPASQWAENIQRERPHTTVISFPTLGGNVGFFAPRCYQDLLQAFVGDPASPLDVRPCEAKSPAITFTVGS